jgi:hypothetical protein
LNWSASDIASIPLAFNIYLSDSTGTNILRDMRSATSYSFTSEGDSTSTFNIKLPVNSSPTSTPITTTQPTSIPTQNQSPTPTVLPTILPTSNPSATASNGTVSSSATPQIPEYQFVTAILILASVAGIMLTIKSKPKKNQTKSPGRLVVK